MPSKFARLPLIAACTGLAALTVWPYHDGVLRFGLPLSLLAVWSSALSLLWRRRFLRAGLLVLPLLFAVPFCLPGQSYGPELRLFYLGNMQRMKGVPYLWGGESRRGIDCSGLPRRALRDALITEGWEHGNGAAFREWARQWWFDTSAKALGEGYRGFTCPLGIRGRLRGLDFSKLEPGDLAITTDGRHVMVFIGNDEWIQADPGPWKVSVGKPAVDPNPWFDAEVSMHRWTTLAM